MQSVGKNVKYLVTNLWRMWFPVTELSNACSPSWISAYFQNIYLKFDFGIDSQRKLYGFYNFKSTPKELNFFLHSGF